MITLQKNLFEGNFPLSQEFGKNPNWYAKFGLKGHNGIDYALPVGTKLYACVYGNVTEIANDTQGYGLYIKIENDTCGILYAHLSKTNVKVGDFVTPSMLIGYSGNTGNSTGPHLHFGVFPKPRDRQNGYAGYIDPLKKTNVTWVDSLERPKDPDAKEPQDQLIADLRASRDKWKQKTFDLEKQIVEVEIGYEKQITLLKAEIKKLKEEIETQNQSGANATEEIIKNQTTLIEILKKLFTRG